MSFDRVDFQTLNHYIWIRFHLKTIICEMIQAVDNPTALYAFSIFTYESITEKKSHKF